MVVERGYGYIGIPGMGLVIASALQKHLFADISLWLLYPLGMTVVWLMGMVDVHSRLFETETEIKTFHNPLLRETNKAFWKKRHK